MTNETDVPIAPNGDTEPAPPASDPTPVLTAIDRVEAVMVEESRALRGALSALRTTVLDHYHAIQSRVDQHAKRLARIEGHLQLPPMDHDLDAP
jgi:hypothetical protein